jgi:hypothetical protein
MQHHYGAHRRLINDNHRPSFSAHAPQGNNFPCFIASPQTSNTLGLFTLCLVLPLTLPLSNLYIPLTLPLSSSTNKRLEGSPLIISKADTQEYTITVHKTHDTVHKRDGILSICSHTTKWHAKSIYSNVTLIHKSLIDMSAEHRSMINSCNIKPYLNNIKLQYHKQQAYHAPNCNAL